MVEEPVGGIGQGGNDDKGQNSGDNGTDPGQLFSLLGELKQRSGALPGLCCCLAGLGSGVLLLRG